MAPPSSASGATWMADGTLPDAPDMRPSVTSATFCPRPCRIAGSGVRLCSSGMPLAAALVADHDDDIALVELAGLEGRADGGLVVKDAHRRLDHAVLGRHRRDLHHRGAQIAGQPRQPAGGLERVGGGAQDAVIAGLARAVAPARRRLQARAPACNGAARRPRRCACRVQQPRLQQLADHVAQPPGGVEMVHVGQPVGIDPRHQRRDLRQIGEIAPVEHDAPMREPSPRDGSAGWWTRPWHAARRCR